MIGRSCSGDHRAQIAAADQKLSEPRTADNGRERDAERWGSDYPPSLCLAENYPNFKPIVRGWNGTMESDGRSVRSDIPRNATPQQTVRSFKSSNE
jgi:hypothetical protein